jgi:nitrite reductase/ring-hydroxylating ferredoxin subunit
LSQRVRVAAVSEIPPGTGREVTAAGRIIAVFNVDGQFYALDGICPHAGGPLGRGTLHGSIVTCPWHGWQFDVTCGKHCLTDNIVQPGYRTLVQADDVFVELP